MPLGEPGLFQVPVHEDMVSSREQLDASLPLKRKMLGQGYQTRILRNGREDKAECWQFPFEQIYLSDQIIEIELPKWM